MISGLRRHGPAFVSAVLASALTAAAPAIAHGVHAKFAHNADKVDNLHAVGSSSTAAERKGKLVATDPTTGRLPNNIIGTAPNADMLDGFDALDFLGVNSKAADANLLDGQNSTAFLGVNGKAADADQLDGLNSTAFGNFGAASGVAFADNCDTPNTWNECGTTTIGVPPGKTYRVLITTGGSFFESSVAENRVKFCASARLQTAAAGASCGPYERGMIVKQGHMVPASVTRVVSLGPGNWVLSMGVNPTDQFDFHGTFDKANIWTHALVVDEAASIY